jgi:hypothetical protein
MSNVLNRTTMVYLESVNTPDFSPTEWIVNPDLSQVTGVPSKYWVIETTPEVQYQPADLYEDPITGEIIDVPEVPYQPELNNIRPMTPEEQAVVDAQAPVEPPEVTWKLNDNTPAFYDTRVQKVRSTNELQVVFSAETPGARNFYLKANGIASNASPVKLSRRCVLLGITASIKAPVSNPITFDVMDSQNMVTNITISASAGGAIKQTNIVIEDTASLMVYSHSLSNYANPTVTMSLAYID